MKLAVIDHIGNPGGGSRVVRSLLPALKNLRHSLDVTYFGNPFSIKREGLDRELSGVGIKVKNLNSVRRASYGIAGIRGSAYFVRKFQEQYGARLPFLPTFITGAVHREMEKVVRGFDLAFFPWPYMSVCPSLDCPMVGIFHDFNHCYYFSGAPTFSRWQHELLKRELPVWLSRSTPAVSTNFMARELRKFYPEFADKVEVVHLASMSTVSKITFAEAQRIVTEELKITKKYILYPANPCAHKNIGPLLAAIPILKRMGHDIVLVITGPEIERINGHACEIGVELGFGEQDVFGLGYVTNLQVDSLIQCASVVVSTSLYEAGNGPGLDAWARGVPVAMSNIPPFLEHLEVQGVRAEVFDPRSPRDIAEKINEILSNPEKAKVDALHSQQALSRLTWEQTAEKYLAVFDKTLIGGLHD